MKTGGLVTQPLQRFSRSRKTAEAVENHGRAKHTQLKLGANEISSQSAFFKCAAANRKGRQKV
jgi:hypothetical protein